MRDLIFSTDKILIDDIPIISFLFRSFIILLVLIFLSMYIYDKYIQRHNQLLINFPLIGRLRYFFYALRDPMRQYFGDEKFYESFDKVKWVLNSAYNKSTMASFSPGQPLKNSIISVKNVNCVLNLDQVNDQFNVTFGNEAYIPFTSKSVFCRSAMSDGAISPEGTRAFAKGSFLQNFPINTGEGGLTSNFLYTHKLDMKNKPYLDTREGTFFAKFVYKVVRLFSNKAIANKVYRNIVIHTKYVESYILDHKKLIYYRIDWSKPLKNFPIKVPDDIPDIIFQIGSGLYGVRNKNGVFDEDRYKKTMCFAKMTEIKIAQGAKQTGGKLLASKVTESISYYRGIEPNKDLFSPNQFPYAKTLEELFDFIGKLKYLSGKPVGVKIVISSKSAFDEYSNLIKKRIDLGSHSYPDFLTIDGGNGGSGAAPLEMMSTVGMDISKALFIANKSLIKNNIRNNIKIIASEKVLTPDDAIALFALGADMIGIARAFMMSAGCIRARECSGANGKACPVGLATQDKSKRSSFLIEKKAKNIASYHKELIYGIRNLLAIAGIKDIKDLNESHIVLKDPDGKLYMDIEKYFKQSIIK